MKKTTIVSCLFLIMMILSACGGTASPNPETGNSQENSSTPSTIGTASNKKNSNQLDTSYSNALPLSTQLIIGTLKLDGTSNEVDADMAKELLPLWKAVKSLSESDTTSNLEIDALYRQIQNTMTTEQIKAIADLELSSDNMMEITQDLGISMGRGGGNMGQMSAEQQATMEANRASGTGGGGMMGGGPGGGMPGGGMMGGGPPDQGSSSSDETTSSAPRVVQVDSNLVEEIIEYLQGKIAQ